MTFDQYTEKSVVPAIVLAELDVGKLNVQWVNNGAGIWCMNTDASYSWVDSTLLSGFTAQNFVNIGSVYSDGLFLSKVDTLAEVTTVDNSFYWDATGNTLYIRLENYDDPILHNIILGVVYGYSFKDINISGAEQIYEGRLTGNMVISASRDPMFFGRIAYTSGGFSLINGDGEFDTFADTNSIYGNEVRVLFGYSNLTYADFKTLSAAMVENVTVSAEEFALTIVDKRKQLTKEVNYSCTNKNALEAIEELLEVAYGYYYGSLYYDTDAWGYAKLYAPPITIQYDDTDAKEKVINIIEEICASIFGVLTTDSQNRFSFKFIGEDDKNIHQIMELTNPILDGAVETSRIMDGDQCDLWYGGDATPLYYAYATDALCREFTTPVATNLPSVRFPYVFTDGTTYYCITHLVTHGPLYLYSSTDKTTWTIMNAGNPVFEASNVPTSIYSYCWNPAVVIIDGTWHFFIECGVTNVGQPDVGLGYSYATLSGSVISFMANATSSHIITGGGNPWAIHVDDKNALVLLHGKINFETPNIWKIRASYASLTDNIALASSWTESPYFDVSYVPTEPSTPNMHTADPDLVALPNTKTYGLLMGFMYNQASHYQCYFDMTLNEFYDRLITPDLVTISKHDILNVPSIDYDPTEAISSVKIGYDKSWSTNDYTYKEYTDKNDVKKVINALDIYKVGLCRAAGQ